MIVTPLDMKVPTQIGDFVVNPASWADFSGPVPANTWFLAYTFWNLDYKIVKVKDKGFQVRVACTLSKKSWHDQECESERLLRHEYGHYLIACLSALSFRREANERGKKTLKLEQYESYCSRLLKEMINKFAKLQQKYDKDTNHYIRQKEQD